MDHFGGVWGNNRATDEDAFLVGDQFDEAVSEISCIATGNNVQRRNGLVNGFIAFMAVIFTEANMGNFWVSEDESRCRGVVGGNLVLLEEVMSSNAAL